MVAQPVSMDQGCFQRELAGLQTINQHRNSEAIESFDFPVLVHRHHPVRHTRFEHVDVLDHIAVFHRPPHGQAADRGQRFELVDAQPRLLPGLALQCLLHRFACAHQATHQRVPQPRVDRLVESALLDPHRTCRRAAHQVRRPGRDAEHAHRGALDQAVTGAGRIDHRHQLVAPAVPESLRMQPCGERGESGVATFHGPPAGVTPQRQARRLHPRAQRRLDRAALGAREPQRLTLRRRFALRGAFELRQPIGLVHRSAARFANSIFAIALRCTSSGPSTMRTVRWCA